jgi:drug/metabolite transporter (DMT)-like permease
VGLLASLIWLGWGMSVGSLMLLVELLRRHEASTVATLLLLLVPAVTAIASAATLGETLHPATLVGMVVAMVGVGAVLRRDPPRGRPIWRANRSPVG